MLAHLKELFQYRELLLIWTWRDVKIRYKQSVLGGVWAILQPLSLMVIFTVVFSFFARVPTDGIPYPIFSYSALLPWTFFATSISFGVPTLVNNMSLVTKIYFPREILPMASIAAAFLDFLVASLILLGMMLFYHVPLYWTLLWLPLLVALQVVLTCGLVLLASAVNVFYRDVRFVVPLAVQLWMYATPIIYPVTLVPERLRTLYMLNPMAVIIDGYRRAILLGKPPEYAFLGLSALIALIILLLGYGFFKRAEIGMADII